MGNTLESTVWQFKRQSSKRDKMKYLYQELTKLAKSRDYIIVGEYGFGSKKVLDLALTLKEKTQNS